MKYYKMTENTFYEKLLSFEKIWLKLNLSKTDLHRLETNKSELEKPQTYRDTGR